MQPHSNVAVSLTIMLPGIERGADTCGKMGEIQKNPKELKRIQKYQEEIVALSIAIMLRGIERGADTCGGMGEMIPRRRLGNFF